MAERQGTEMLNPLVSVSTDETIAFADQIKDDSQGVNKKQSVINAEVQNALAGKAEKVTNATEDNFAAFDANGNLKDSGKKAGDFVSSADVSGKANKVASATTGNFAKLKADGDIEDSGKSENDFAAANHDHDNAYAAKNHDHEGVYQPAGSYAPSSHTHAIADVTGLQDALDEIRDIAELALVM